MLCFTSTNRQVLQFFVEFFWMYEIHDEPHISVPSLHMYCILNMCTFSRVHPSTHMVLSYSVYCFCTNNITIMTFRGQHKEKPPRSGLHPSRAVPQPPLTSTRPPMTSSRRPMTSPRPPMTSCRPPRPSGGPASGSQTLPSSPTVFASHSPVPQVRNSFC